MALKLGSFSVNKIYLGVSEITKAYLGSTEVYSVGGVDTYAVAGFSPALVTDFSSDYYRTSSNDTTFDTAVTHARNSNATMVDSDGLLKWAPHNELTYSEQFDNAIWVKNNATVTANTAIDPDGTTTADKIIEGSTNAIHFITQTISYVAGQTYTHAIWAQPNERSVIQFVFTSLAFASGLYANFSLVGSGSTVQSSGVSATITKVGDWYLCTVTATAETTASGGAAWVLQDSASAARAASYTGDGTSGLYLWGAHLYRSDLGGMVDNPDRGDSYVPTTTSARYLPRRGHHVYNGSAWVNEGLLVESEQRTNLVTYSETIEAGTGQWSIAGGDASTTQDAATSPDGLSQAVKLYEGTTTNTFKAIYLNPFSASSNNICASVFVKAAERNYAAIQCVVNSGRHTILVDLSNGSIVDTDTSGTPTIVSVGVEDVGNGWYRGHVALAHTGGTITMAIAISDTASPSYSNAIPVYTGDGTSGIYIYGAQLEAGSTPSSYIPNAGTSGGVTRAAETLTVPAAQLPYDSTAMSIQMDGRQTGDSYTLNRWYADASNYITQESGASDFTFEQNNAATVDSVTGGSFTSGILVPYNIASRHGSTFINGAVDGTALTANTTPTALPDLSTTDLNLAYDYNGTIKLFRVWANDLGDDGIEEASTDEYLFDQYSGAAAAYSLRDLSSTNTNVVKVRRSSDNAEQDFTATEINNGTLKTWVGANDGFVVTWYDQSGNSNDATQATAASQPKIVSSGVLVTENGKAALNFDGINDFLKTSSFSSVIPQPTTWFSVVGQTSTGTHVVAGGLADSSRQIPYASVSQSDYCFAGTNLFGQFVSTGHFVFTTLFNGLNSTLHKNGSLSASGNAGSNVADGITVGARYLNDTFWVGEIQELILYPSDQSSNRTGIETNINDYYGIY